MLSKEATAVAEHLISLKKQNPSISLSSTDCMSFSNCDKLLIELQNEGYITVTNDVQETIDITPRGFSRLQYHQ